MQNQNVSETKSSVVNKIYKPILKNTKTEVKLLNKDLNNKDQLVEKKEPRERNFKCE